MLVTVPSKAVKAVGANIGDDEEYPSVAGIPYQPAHHTNIHRRRARNDLHVG